MTQIVILIGVMGAFGFMLAAFWFGYRAGKSEPLIHKKIELPEPEETFEESFYPED